MPVNVISYEVLRIEPEVEILKKALNDMGRKGFEVHHTHVDASGAYTIIFCKDTGITADEESTAGGWVDDGFVTEETSWQ